MVQTYFLGANSKDGFCSLYGNFPPEKTDFLHIIKSGPGTGKSSFMRKIGKTAEKRGLDVHYVLCSGDPDSLDGVYIPALKEAWVDGTAPHIIEPIQFGVNSDYVNLGKFCSRNFSQDEVDYVNSFNREYKAKYQSAYAYLASATKIRQASMPAVFSEKMLASSKNRIKSIINRKMSRNEDYCGSTSIRFLSAVSCRGQVQLKDEIIKLCKLIYCLDSSFSEASTLLSFAAEQAELMQLETIRCPCPLEPEKLEAVLLPKLSLAFVDKCWQFENCRNIRLDSLIPSEAKQLCRQELRESQRLEKRIMDMAYSKLAQAKQLHDRLEEVYKTHMDFPALTKFTESEIKRIFK